MMLKQCLWKLTPCYTEEQNNQTVASSNEAT